MVVPQVAGPEPGRYADTKVCSRVDLGQVGHADLLPDRRDDLAEPASGFL